MENTSDLATIISIFSAIFIIGFTILLYIINKLLKADTKKWAPGILQKLSALEIQVNEKDDIKKQMALMEADKLLDKVFMNKKIKGESMGERLKNAVKYFEREEYNRIWDAHKARNVLAHETDRIITGEYLLKHFNSLKSAIKKLAK